MSTSIRSRVRPSMRDADQRLRLPVVVERCVDEVHAEHAEGFLLPRVLQVPHARVDDDLGRAAVRFGLEPDAQPALPFSGPDQLLAATVSANTKNLRRGPARGIEPLQEEGPLVVEHGLEALPAHVALAPRRRPRPKRSCRRRKSSWPPCRPRHRRGRTTVPLPGRRRSRRMSRTGPRRY